MWCLHSHFADETVAVKGFVSCPSSLPSPASPLEGAGDQGWAEAGMEHPS